MCDTLETPVESYSDDDLKREIKKVRAMMIDCGNWSFLTSNPIRAKKRYVHALLERKSALCAELERRGLLGY